MTVETCIAVVVVVVGTIMVSGFVVVIVDPGNVIVLVTVLPGATVVFVVMTADPGKVTVLSLVLVVVVPGPAVVFVMVNDTVTVIPTGAAGQEVDPTALVLLGWLGIRVVVGPQVLDEELDKVDCVELPPPHFEVVVGHFPSTFRTATPAIAAPAKRRMERSMLSWWSKRALLMC